MKLAKNGIYSVLFLMQFSFGVLALIKSITTNVRILTSHSYRSMRSLCLHDNKRNWSPVSQPSQDSDTGDEEPGIAYTVEMGKSCGIRCVFCIGIHFNISTIFLIKFLPSWGSDLSFRWIYVMDIDPNGEAAGNVFKGIHLTFSRPFITTNNIMAYIY